VHPALLRGKTAVITGGAGAIGAAICEMFAGEGANVVVADIHRQRTEELVERLHQRGDRAVAAVLDVTSRSGVDDLLRITSDAFGGADILVNGVGEAVGGIGAFEDNTEEQWQGLYEMNLLHVIRASHAFLPEMKRRGWGRIVNFSSVEGIRAAPGFAVYTAFKGAVNSFTRSLAVDVARYGVLVNAIAVDKTRSHQVGFYELPPEYARLVGVWIPAGRYGEGEDIAKVTLFLASDLNTWVVGQAIPADGGTLAAGGWFRTPKRWTNQPLLTQYLEDDPALNEARPPMVQ
jgi:NAD(P)-dependent dehydrogenase (short-subunit alcohol dehydrogenase family)